jgi:type I restriction enzyme S subunit
MEAKRRNHLVTGATSAEPGLVPQDELKWTSVSLQELLSRNLRLEASVYGVEGKHARDLVDSSKWDKRSLAGQDGLTVAFTGPRFKRTFLKHSDVPIFQPSQITDMSPRPHLFLSAETPTDLESLRVQKGQILMTCSGTTGICALVADSYDGQVFSHDLLRITPIDPLDTGYLYAFFKTSAGQALLNSNNYGAVIQHIEAAHLEKISVPYPSARLRTDINETIIDSYARRDEANRHIKEAETLLMTVLGLPDYEEFFESNGIDAHSVPVGMLKGRFEASYHSTDVDKIMQHLAEHAEQVKSLSEPTLTKSIKLPGRFARIYVKEGQGVTFFGGKQIYELDPGGKKFLSLKLHGSRIEQELALQANTILVTRSGTIGRVQLAPAHWDGWVINEHVLRVSAADESLAGYLYIWLQSKYGERLIKRLKYGAVVDEIDDRQLATVAVPIVSAEVMQKVNAEALRANELRHKAYLLEREAIAKVEKEVLGIGNTPIA